MNLAKIPMMGAIVDKLSWLSRRQEVISENVANANTSGFKAQTIKDLEFRDILRSSQQNGVKAPKAQVMRSTNPKHLGHTAAKTVSYDTITDVTATESSINGNTVVLEEQMLKMAETQIEYSTMINLYRRHMGLVKTALGNRGR